MRRRDLIEGLCTLPFASAHSQTSSRKKLVAILLPLSDDDPETQARLAALRQSLNELGYIEGQNIRTAMRSGRGNPDLYLEIAKEIVDSSPDVIVTMTALGLQPLLKITHTIPIVFVQVVDPVGFGLVSSLAHPGGNATGFTQFESSLSAKWLELLLEIAPKTRRVAVIVDASISAGIGQLSAIQGAANQFSQLSVHVIDGRVPDRITVAVAEFSKVPNGGLIVSSTPAVGYDRRHIIALAEEFRLPSVYSYKYIVAEGGLISYGPDTIEPFRRAASYVDRILKGEKPADLPVQAPIRYELAVNVKSARKIGIELPATLLARCDQVFE